MAKSKDNATAATEESPASVDDTKLAMRAVMDITGCGQPAARDRVASMKPSMVAKIAKLEREQKRVEIVTLLY